DGRRVLADILRIAGLSLAGDPLDVAEKEAGEIEHVNSHIENRIAFRLMQVRLNGINVVAGAKGDASPGWFADRAAVDNGLQLAHRRLPAEILVDRESHSGVARGRDDFARFVPIGSQRLLEDDVDAASRDD